MDQTDQVKTNIYNLYIKFIQQKDQYEDSINSVLQEELRQLIDPDISLNMTEIHVISCIGHHEPINVTSLADRMELSKGNISKITYKLLKRGWVRRTQLNDNKKEIYFRLTSPGKKLFAIHEQLHRKEQLRLYGFLDGFSESELVFIRRFFLDFIDLYETRESEG
ncbi:MarR family transcriptional regulator [Paenibacillus filicis]|uniref:MarR family transcriptional regulator n=1 Tax=Paenibacillus filicis TaxID=669464 RepID=A0ABU9DE76_9BACL